MASDWIKMRIDLDTDPGVVRISSATSADRYQTVGRLHKVWAWADCHSIDGKNIPVGADFVDSIVDCNGFAAAMASVGWLEIAVDSVSFPHFDRHNGESAKRRATDQKRKKNVRNVSAKCPQKSGLEKRREEKRRISSPPTPSLAESNEPHLEEGEEVWDWIREELILLGVVKPKECLDAARSHGCTPELVRSVVQHFAERPGAWKPGALYERIRTMFPAQKNPNDLWPQPDASYEKSQRKSAEVEKRTEAERKRQAEENERQKKNANALASEEKYGKTLDSMPPAEWRKLILARDGPSDFYMPFMPKRGEKPSGILRSELLTILENREAATLVLQEA
jgi:hypothetical protein